MAPREASDSPGAVATSALRGLQASARLAPLVTKEKWASQATLGPQASQVSWERREKSCPCPAPLEQKDFPGPPASRGHKVTEVFLEAPEGRASLERRVPSASLGLDFLGLLAPKALMVYLETLDLLGIRVVKASTAYLATPVHLARRASLESVCRDSKACLGYLASLAPPGRRETSEDRAFLESTAPSAPQASRGSEVTRDLLDCKAPEELRESPESALLEQWAPPEDRDPQGHQAPPE